jgi:DMSO reductase anchor subunit
MHPAYSVILFTTASGAGYGLLFWLGLVAAIAPAESGGRPGLIALAIGLGLVTLGLLSSTFHLGRPERAWRAFSQWRSSWLSREGVAAVATYVPAGLLGLAWLVPGTVPGVPAVGLALALGAAATVWCTGMIYASLRTVPEWNLGLVPALYLVLAAASGALLLAALGALAGRGGAALPALAALALAAGLGLKRAYWRRIGTARAPYTVAQALGIPGARGIRPLDPPHTRPNFVMREMGYAIARRHAARLRRWCLGLLFALPLAATLAALAWPATAAAALLVALPPAAAGLWLERWLFFAEARHVSMLYYPPPGASAER